MELNNSGLVFGSSFFGLNNPTLQIGDQRHVFFGLLLCFVELPLALFHFLVQLLELLIIGSGSQEEEYGENAHCNNRGNEPPCERATQEKQTPFGRRRNELGLRKDLA